MNRGSQTGVPGGRTSGSRTGWFVNQEFGSARRALRVDAAGVLEAVVRGGLGHPGSVLDDLQFDLFVAEFVDEVQNLLDLFALLL